MSRFTQSQSSLLFSVLTGAALFSAACTTSEADESQPVEEAAQAVSAKLVRATKQVPGQYIVVLKPGQLAALGEDVSQVSAAMLQSVGGQLIFQYEAALKGFSAKMSEEAAKRLLADPRVDFIEEDGVFELNATQFNPQSWGLDRIDQQFRPLNQQYSYTSNGAGVHAYIIDTGIRRDHVDFTGRIGNHFDAVTPGGLAEDCQGHGTHVSGTVGGTVTGVAKNVTLHPIRVFGCSGGSPVSTIINGVNWVTANRILPAVANMSLGGGASPSMDMSVLNSINSGITYVVAAGNSSADACGTSPARVPQAITVAASDINDVHASFSNWGTCVDLYAPGVSIFSAWFTANNAAAILSGTSMASPHVAGMAARVIQGGGVRDITGAILATATPGVISGAPAGTPNRLLFRSPAQ